MPEGFTLVESARRCALAAELERRCFAVLGGWVQSTPEPVPKLLFARQARHHAWHAELFAGLTPVANGPGRDPRATMPAEWEELLDALAGVPDTDGRLVRWFGLLVPAKVAAYDAWLGETSPVSDGPVRRWLGVVLADEREDHRGGEAMLANVGGPEAAAMGKESVRLASVLWES